MEGCEREVEGQANVPRRLAKVTTAHPPTEAVGKGLGESCGRERRADMQS